jgi:hypothetical protein
VFAPPSTYIIIPLFVGARSVTWWLRGRDTTELFDHVRVPQASLGLASGASQARAIEAASGPASTVPPPPPEEDDEDDDEEEDEARGGALQATTAHTVSKMTRFRNMGAPVLKPRATRIPQ